MALQAVVFPQDPLSYTCNKDNYLYFIAASGGPWNNPQEVYGFQEQPPQEALNNNNNNNNVTDSMDQWDSYNSNSSPEPCITTIDHDQSSLLGANNSPLLPPVEAAASSNTVAGATTMGRRKRRRTKSVKNKEEIENQRMTHIAVERNRRKQMNEYLAVLRSLMPPSYVQRGDQASIIGGAINFVKELEQLLQCMNGQKKRKQEYNNNTVPFAEFFMFPQYSTHATRNCHNKGTVYPPLGEAVTVTEQISSQSAAVDIEVSLVDRHANMKILSKKQHGLLVKMVIGLQNLGFTILHLNVTTASDMVLISVSVKVEEGSQLNTVDEIAASVNELLRTIHEEVPLCADHQL